MTSVAMAQSNYTTEGRRMTTTSEATATTTNTNTNNNNNNAGGISPSESTMTTSAYMVRVMAMNSSYDIPVTPHTRVSSVLREVAELAISFEQSIALGDVHAALCHGDIVLPVDGPIGLLPQNAVLRLLTNFDAGFDAIDEHLTVTLMSYHTIQQQQIQMQQQRLQRQASMRTTAASLHGMRRVGSRSGLVTVPETSLILSPYDASLSPNSMLYPHAVVLAPHGKAQPYVIGQPATHYAGRSLVMSPPPPVGAAQYVAATPMPIVNGILATGTNTAVPHVAGTPWAMTEGSGAGAVYRVPIRSADELLLPADLAERQRRATTATTLTAYQSAPRSKSAQQDRFGTTTTPTKSSPFVPLDPNGIKPKNRASGTSFRSIISLVSRPFSLGRRSSSSPQTGSVHTNLTEEERRENSSPQSVHAEQTPLPLKKESNGQPQTNYPIESNNNHNHQQQQQRLSSQEEVEVEDREGSFEHEPRSFTRPPVDRRATLDEMHDAGSGPADGTLLSPHSAPAVDTTNTKVEDYSSLHEDKENIHNNKEGAEVQEAPMPVRRVSKSMTDTSQSHTLPSDHVISFNTTTLPSLPKTGTLAEEEEEDNMGELNEKEQQPALVKKEKRKASTTVNSAPPSPEGAAVVKAAVRRRRSSPNAAPATTTAAASSSSHTSTASRTRITSVTRRMSEGGDPNNLAAVGSAMAAVANKRQQQQQHQEEEHHHTPHTPTHLPILHSIEISHPRKRGHISTTTTTTTTKAAEAASKASAVRESIRGAAYMTVRDNSQTPTEKALAHENKKEKTEEDELEEEERVRTPKPAHRKNSSATRLRHSKDVSPTLEEQIVKEEKEVLKSEKRRASQERAGSKERSLLSGGGAIRERSHPLPSLPQLSPKSLKEVHGSVKETETRRISIAGTHSSSRSTPSLKPLPSPTAAATADTKKKATNKKASPHAAATNDTRTEEQVMSSTGRRPRRTPRSPQATTITAVGGDAGTTANYTGTSPADDYALPFTPSPTPHTLVNPNTDTTAPAPVTANIAHTALPNKATVKKSKGSGATKESSEEKAAAAAKKESLSPHKHSTEEETENNNETPAAPPQPKSILMISSLPRYTHQITFNTRGGRRKSSQLSSPSSALHTPNSANGHARGSATSAKHASSSSSVERDSAHYTVESFDTEGKEFIRITLRDPIDPTIFHFSVPVDRHCPVGALRSWLTDEIAARAREDGRPVPAFMDVKRYALYCGDTRLVDDSRLTFEDATRGKHDCIFSIRLLR